MSYHFFTDNLAADIDNYQRAYDRDYVEWERNHVEMIPLWKDEERCIEIAHKYADELHLFLEKYPPEIWSEDPVETDEEILAYCLEDLSCFADFCVEKGWADEENPV